MLIYALIDPRTNEIRYIGKTIFASSRRLKQHTSASNRNKNNHRSHWLNSMHNDSVIPEIVELCYPETMNELNETEKFLIAFGREIGLPLTNTTIGGDGAAGFKRPPATIEKMKIAQRNAPWKKLAHSPEHIENFRKSKLKTIYCEDGRVFKGIEDASHQLAVSAHTVIRALWRHEKPKIGGTGRPSLIAMKLSYEPIIDKITINQT